MALALDGAWGPETRKALAAFQAQVGLVGEPLLSEITLGALFRSVEPPKLGWIESLAISWAEKKLKGTPMFEALEGKKTYIAVAVVAIAIIANHFFGPLPGIELDPDQWLVQLGALVFPVTIRGAIPDKNKVENGGSK